jgi:hypothetical protein
MTKQQIETVRLAQQPRLKIERACNKYINANPGCSITVSSPPKLIADSTRYAIIPFIDYASGDSGKSFIFAGTVVAVTLS